LPECSTGESPSIVVWGDSFAMHVVGAIRVAHPTAQVAQLTKSYCGPVLDLAPVSRVYPVKSARGCLEFNRQALEFIEQRKSVRYVVLSSPFSQYLFDSTTFLTAAGEVPSGPDALATAFLQTIDVLEGLGLKVIIVSPPPATGSDLGQCVVRSRHFGAPDADCDFRRAESDARSVQVTKLLRLVERSGRRVVWLADTICPSGRCIAAAGEVILYRDANHLSREGSAYIGETVDFLPLRVQ
jgi:hypothetical protein